MPDALGDLQILLAPSQIGGQRQVPFALEGKDLGTTGGDDQILVVGENLPARYGVIRDGVAGAKSAVGVEQVVFAVLFQNEGGFGVEMKPASCQVVRS